MRYLRFEQLINGRAARTTKREWSTESQASCFKPKDMIIPSSKFNETGTILPHYPIRLRVELEPDSRLSHAIVAVKQPNMWCMHCYYEKIAVLAACEAISQLEKTDDILRHQQHFSRQMTSEIWVLLFGRAAWEICFNQSEALSRSGQ